MPVTLGHRVAEPLVRRLVTHHAFAHAPLDVRLLRVEDRARILHPAEPGGGLDVGELPVRERPDEPLQDVDDLGRAPERDRVGVGRVFGVGPDLDGDRVPPADQGTVPAHGELGGTEDHGVGGNGAGLGPGAAAHPAVGDDPPRLRRKHRERDRRLVRRVIHRGQPIARPLRPVIRERGATPVGVRPDDQPVLGRAVVAHHDRERGAPVGPQGDAQHAAVVGERCAWSVLRPGEPHGVDGHPDEVECEHAVAGCPPLEVHQRIAADRPTRIGEGDEEYVALHVDPALLRPPRRRRRDEQRRQYATARSHTPPPAPSRRAASAPCSRSPPPRPVPPAPSPPSRAARGAPPERPLP